MNKISYNKILIYFFSLQDSEHIGDVYQDEFNQAALLLYRDKTDDALLMVRFTELIITYLLLKNNGMKSFKNICHFPSDYVNRG